MDEAAAATAAAIMSKMDSSSVSLSVPLSSSQPPSAPSSGGWTEQPVAGERINGSMKTSTRSNNTEVRALRSDGVDAEISDESSSSSEDEEEIMRWAQKMFGITPPNRMGSPSPKQEGHEKESEGDDSDDVIVGNCPSSETVELLDTDEEEEHKDLGNAQAMKEDLPSSARDPSKPSQDLSDGPRKRVRLDPEMSQNAEKSPEDNETDFDSDSAREDPDKDEDGSSPHPNGNDEDELGLYAALNISVPPFGFVYCDNSTVRDAIISEPDAAKKKYSFDHIEVSRCAVYPLFQACCVKPSYDVVNLIYRAYPKALQASDEFGWTCLHAACWYQAPTDVITLLVEKYPEALGHHDDAGWTPFRMVIENKFSDRDVMQILERYHEALNRKDSSSWTPLEEDVLYRFGSDELLQTIIQKYPEDVHRADYSGNTPFHIACDKARERAIDLFTKMQPDALEILNSEAMSPFHIACKKRASYATLRNMLLFKPQLADFPCGDGQKPLWLLWNSIRERMATEAYQDQSWDEELRSVHRKIDLLIQTIFHGTAEDGLVTPKAAGTNRLAKVLHETCSMHAYRFLVDDFPLLDEELNHFNEMGPVRSGSRSKNRLLYKRCVIKSITGICPAAASIHDKNGRLPIHTALERRMSWLKGGVHDLAIAAPGSMKEYDPKTGLYPFQMAAAFGWSSQASTNTTFELLVSNPELVWSRTERKHG